MFSGMEAPDRKDTGYIVFYGTGGDVLAIIECVFDPSAVSSGDVLISFTEQSAQYADMLGFTLEHLTSGPLYDTYFDGVAPVYHLTYTCEGMHMSVKLPSNVKKHNVNPWMLKDAIRVNNVPYDTDLGPSSAIGEITLDDEGAVEIYMNIPEGSDKTMIRGNINFLDASDAVIVVLVCTLDLREQ